MIPLSAGLAARRLVPVLVVLATTAAACGILAPDPEPREEFAAALSKWNEQGFNHYEFHFQRSACECLPEWTRPYVIRVDGGRIVDVSDAETGVAAPESFRPYTILQLFDLVEDALDRSSHVLIVDYHPHWGYPTHISIDYDRQTVDDEFTVRVRNLEPLP